MSGEQLTAKELNKTPIDHSSKKVDINDLLSKVRQEKFKEKKIDQRALFFHFPIYLEAYNVRKDDGRTRS